MMGLKQTCHWRHLISAETVENKPISLGQKIIGIVVIIQVGAWTVTYVHVNTGITVTIRCMLRIFYAELRVRCKRPPEITIRMERPHNDRLHRDEPNLPPSR